MKVYSLIAAIIALTSCAPSPSNRYKVVVDNNLDEASYVGVQDAASAWSSVVGPTLHITVERGDVRGLTAPDDRIYVHASNIPAIANMGFNVAGSIGFTDHDPDSADIYVPVKRDANMSDQSFLQMITHEMGHGFNLMHSNSGDIMCFSMGCASNAPSCGDVAQFMDLRGLPHKTPACPHGGSYTLTGK